MGRRLLSIGTAAVMRHAVIVVSEDGFVVQCKACRWTRDEVFAEKPKAEAAVDMHEVIRHAMR